MPRIAEINACVDLPSEAAALLDLADRSGAPDPRMARVLIRSGAGVRFLQYWADALYSGDLPHRLKEIVRIFLSASEGCAYCSTVRSAEGAAAGVSDDLLLKLGDIETNELLTEQERAALLFARRMKAGEADSDAVFEDLRKQFSEEEILELGLFCGIVMGAGSFAKLLKVVTWDEVCTFNPNMKRLREIGSAG